MSEPPAFHPDLHGIARWLPHGVVRPWLMPALRLVPRHGKPSKLPEGLTFREQRLGNGPAFVRIFAPTSGTDRPVLLWLHGGGFVVGSAKQDDALAAWFATELGAVVVSVDYRLAPESPFPAALDDCQSAFDFIHAESATLGIDPRKLVILGISAGGGLAAALSHRAHDQRRPRPLMQVLVYPMLDDRTTLRPVDGSMHRLWDQRCNHFAWRSYLGREPGGPDVDPFAAPARHENLTGLAPTWIGVGTADLFLAEDLAYAERLRAAGVSVETCIVEGAFHGFDQAAKGAQVTRRFHAAQRDAIKAALQTQAQKADD